MSKYYKSDPVTPNETYEIVIIEDDEGLNHLICKNLKREGYSCVQAFNGTQAIDVVNKKKNQIIILDYKLPDLNGEEIIMAIKVKNESIPPFIVMTGFGDEKIAVKMMKLGAIDYIIKDSDFIEILIKKLEQIVEELERKKENVFYQKLLQNTERLAGVGGWLWFVKSDKWIMSDNWMTLHGCSEKFFSTDSLIKIAHPDDAERIKNAFAKTATTGKPYQVEHKIIRQDNGEVRNIKAFGEAELDADGNVEIVSGAALDITEFRKKEVYLSDSEERLRVLFESSPDAIYLHDLKGKFIDGNQTAEKMLGYKREELIGKSFTKLKLLPAKYLKKAAGSLLKNAQGKAAGPDEYELIHRDGQKIPVEIRSFPVNIQGKKLIMGIAHDIIHRKKAEATIRKNEQKLRTIFDNAALGIFRSTPKGRYEEVNEAFARMLGFDSPQKMLNEVTDISLLYKYPEDREKIIKEFAEKGFVENYEIEANHPQKEIVWISVNAKQQHTPDGRIYYEGTIQDITKKKIAEEKLRETEKRLHILAENIPDEIFIKDDQHRFLYVNPKKAKSDGTTPEAMIGKTDFDYFSEPVARKSRKDDEQVLKTGKPIINKEERLTGIDGESRWVLVTKLPRFDEYGNTIGTMGISRDITLLKQTEKDLIQAKEKAEESDKLKSAFLANMSHEIRTPMNGILGFTNLLQEPSLTGEQQKEFIDIIQKSGDRMLNTVNDLIDISRIETGQVKVTKEQIDICHEIKSLYTFFQPEAEQKGLQFTFENNLRDVDSRIITDKTKFVSITTNLIKNALKYTKEGSVKIGCEIKDGNFIFHVNDTGIGIPKNRQQAIFNRFEQADIGDSRVFEGSGLGLAITKAYVEMLNGKIEVESEEGVGSTFRFTLPWTTGESDNIKIDTPEMKQPSDQSGYKPKILIAEDDEVSFYHLSIIIEKHAREIVRAANGRQAVEIFKQQPDIDIILMDIRMPVLNGYETARQIRKFNTKVVIIAQTAFALQGDREKAIEAGCNDYISKPVNTDELMKKIEKYGIKTG